LSSLAFRVEARVGIGIGCHIGAVQVTEFKDAWSRGRRIKRKPLAHN
jgi:hypothetical protein